MSLTKIVQEYEDFFSWENRVQESDSDGGTKDIEMNKLQSLGIAVNLDELIKTAKSKKIVDLEKKARLFYRNGFLSEAFFYHFIGERSKGRSLEDIRGADSLYEFGIADTPYTLHQMHLKSMKNRKNPTYIFLDWDGTLETNSNLREKTLEFLNYFNNINNSLRTKKYVMIITSASSNLREKVDKYKIADKIDAIFSVPIIHKVSKNNENFLSGKLYTDICRRLDVSYKRAIILTDIWGDKSVEKSYPITTIVTPKNGSTDMWIDTIRYFEMRGDYNIREGAGDTITQPTSIIESQSKNIKKDWKVYSINDKLHLLRNSIMEDCFFIKKGDMPKELPNYLPREIKAMPSPCKYEI
ncbi:MAG: HAD family hydrolase [Nanoarchaeota archaeon]|nr:HAD family hydrolase [Nanoarchaeota archaeon]